MSTKDDVNGHHLETASAVTVGRDISPFSFLLFHSLSLSVLFVHDPFCGWKKHGRTLEGKRHIFPGGCW